LRAGGVITWILLRIVSLAPPSMHHPLCDGPHLQDINSRRSTLLIPGGDLGPTEDDSRIPVVLIQVRTLDFAG